MKLDRIIAVRNNKTIYRDNDRCVKVFNYDYSKADVLSEALNQARMEETALNIPKILEVTMVDGKWAIVSEYIKGKTLARLMEEDSTKKDEYLGLLVDLQNTVHKEKCPVLCEFSELLDLGIASTDLEATSRYALHTDLREMPRGNTLCHGDLRPSNIIISSNSVPYIIDWSNAARGSVPADAASTYLMMLLGGDTEDGEKYLQLFCQKTGTDKQDILKWVSIVAAAKSVKFKGSKREFLLSHINS